MEALAYAVAALVFAFCGIKVFFLFLAWLFPEADKLHRNQLDVAFDVLDRHTLFELGRITLLRVLEPVEHFIRKGWIAYEAIVFVSLAQNAIVFTVASTAVIATYFQSSLVGVGAVLFGIYEGGVLKFCALNGIIAVLGMAFDVFSIWVTVVLIRGASVAATGGSLVKHLVIDAVVAILSCTWAYVMLAVGLRTYYVPIYDEVQKLSGGEAHRYMASTLLGTLSVNPTMWYVIVGLGISAALPTLAYLTALVPVIALRLVPLPVQNLLKLIVFRLTTDREPVLKQLSSAASNAGALLAGIVTWVKATAG